MKKLLFIWLLITSLAFGALPSTSVWEVRPTVGADTNGGGFDSAAAGTDMSVFNNKNATACTSCQSSTSNISTTDAVANGSTTITSATAAFTSAITGNIIRLSGGSGSLTAGWYRATFVGATSITVDRTVATGTAIVMNIGGALSTISQANTNSVANNITYIKATGTYTVTTAMIITLDSTSAPGNPLSFIGYTTSRTDNGQITWTTSTNSIDLVDLNGARNVTFQNIIFSSTAGTPASGLKANTTANSFQVSLINCKLTGFLVAIEGNFNTVFSFIDLMVINSRITNNTSHGIRNSASTLIFGSQIDNNGGDGANYSSGSPAFNAAWTIVNSIFYKNTGSGLNTASTSFFDQTTCPYIWVQNSDFSTNSVAGIIAANVTCPQYQISNSIFDANGTFGIDGGNSTITLQAVLYNNAFFNNTTAASRDVNAGIGTITLGSSPYTSIGSNFALNGNNNGGKLLKGAGFPGAIPGAGTGGLDVGAIQTVASGSGGQVGFGIVQ